MPIEVTVTPEHEEFAARLGRAGCGTDVAAADAIIDEIADAGLECTLAVLAVQTRNLVMLLKLTRGPDEALELFTNTIAEAQAAIDDH
jgi:hypothetical protein